MFSGIVEDVGTVVSLTRRAGGALLRVATALPLSEVRIGDSVAVSGACITVTGKEGKEFTANLSAETLSRTTFGTYRTGTRVNLERSLSLSARLDGHLVYGHVDGTGTVREIRLEGDSRVFHIQADPSIMKFVVYKGAVAVDGVSLTVSSVRTDGFEVALIPLTLGRTTWGGMRPGGPVNVETDIVGKYVLRFLEGLGDGVSRDFLKKHGFA
ncbi:MAG TPA: riboflavin synthase [Deltaproteobacteria bacterium]|nr:MAG: riboflavin synthase subunit alpha [Deltaproteobacteria bacterium GWC2_65_14]HBO68842.1 riboflavin synthase [Deltaproteobacteria bacterium]